ncbi:hypothetical protein SNEBB_004272 [Seison nebaliae]|nr:hypothetical protein SNEBB_004272 [Seison nebaliae]
MGTFLIDDLLKSPQPNNKVDKSMMIIDYKIYLNKLYESLLQQFEILIDHDGRMSKSNNSSLSISTDHHQSEEDVSKEELSEKKNKLKRDCNDENDLMKKNKKRRILFTKQQISILETEFEKRKYLNSNERDVLAKKIDLHPSQVKIWFQNHRYKLKKAYQYHRFT